MVEPAPVEQPIKSPTEKMKVEEVVAVEEPTAEPVAGEEQTVEVVEFEETEMDAAFSDFLSKMVKYYTIVLISN